MNRVNVLLKTVFTIALSYIFIAGISDAMATDTISRLAKKNNIAIVIDPGHSPLSPGATGCSGKLEYRYNNALAKVVSETLQRKGISVTWTKTDNAEQPLLSRANAATNQQVFLSIHHDSVQPEFIDSKTGCSDKASGYSIFISHKSVHYDKALQYARKLGESLLKRGLHPTLHHAEPIPGENRKLIDPRLGIYLFDELVVLKNAKIPALLFEAAVIVNSDDEKRADSEEYRRSVAEAILEML